MALPYRTWGLQRPPLVGTSVNIQLCMGTEVPVNTATQCQLHCPGVPELRGLKLMLFQNTHLSFTSKYKYYYLRQHTLPIHIGIFKNIHL